MAETKDDTTKEQLAENGGSSVGGLSCCKTFIYGMPGGCLLPFTAMWALYGNKYYEEFGANLSIIMLFTAVARSFDLIADPLISYITDIAGSGCLSCRCFKKFGRRKPFMFVGSFCMGCSVWMLLNPPYAGRALLSLWFGFFYVVYYVWESITAVPYNAFGAELSESSDERTGAFFMEGLFEGMGTLVLVIAPIGFTMVSVPGYSERNEKVCVESDDMAKSCLVGESCDGFFESGWSQAYVLDEVLRDKLVGTALKAINGVIEVMDYRSECSAWSQFESAADRESWANKVIDGSASQNDDFCTCFTDCNKACNVAENRTAFMCVGYFFAAYIIPTVWLSCCTLHSVYDPAIHGQREDGEVKKAPPLVPSLMSAMENKMFRILLPTWTCDGLVQAVVMALPYYYVQAVIAPGYMTMEVNGIDCAPSSAGYTHADCGGAPGPDGKPLCTGLAGIKDTDEYDMKCNNQMVMALAGTSFLLGAFMSLPVWMCLVKTIGKIKCWFLMSLTHCVFCIGFLFLGEGQVFPLWGLTCLNGIPFGAKFLNDSILADIVDYDEFLTANRKEATYFMAKSFIPKVVQIPAAVLPIAFLPAVGYLEPHKGVVQYQPDSVLIYIKCVSFIGVIAAAAAWILKFKYKLTNTDLLEKSLQDIKDGREGIDPVSGVLWRPTDIEGREDAEREVFYECSYFSRASMRGVLTETAAREAILRKTKTAVIIAIIITFVFVGGLAGTINQLENPDTGFAPTLFMIACGLMVAVNLFTVSRYKAAKNLLVKLESTDAVQAESQQEPGKGPVLKKQVTQDSITKFIDYVEKRDKVGGSSRSDMTGSTRSVGEEKSVISEDVTAPVKPVEGTNMAVANVGLDKVAMDKVAAPDVEEPLDYTAPSEGTRVTQISQAPVKCASQRGLSNQIDVSLFTNDAERKPLNQVETAPPP